MTQSARFFLKLKEASFKSRNSTMKSLAALIISTLFFMSATSSASGDTCYDEKGRKRPLTITVQKELTADYYTEFRRLYPQTPNMLISDFTNKHIFAHVICRLNGCTRAASITSHQTARRVDTISTHSEIIETVLCKASPKGGWTTLWLNRAYKKYRPYLPEAMTPPKRNGNILTDAIEKAAPIQQIQDALSVE